MSKWNAEWFTVPGTAVFDPGGQVTSVSRSEGQVDLFTVGYDSRVWTQFWNQAGWHSDWFPLPGAAVFDKQSVSVVSRDDGHLDLFVVGYDSRVWTQFWSADKGWNGDWFPVPGAAVFDKQPVAAVSRDDRHLDLFVVGYDSRVWTQFWSADNGWSGDWFALPGAAVFEKQAVAAVSRDRDHLDLFVHGYDSRVWSQFWSADNGWHADWMPIPGAAVFRAQAVSALSRHSGRLDLFLMGYDDHVWTSSWSADSGWRPDWAPVPGQTLFGGGRTITPATRTTSHMDLYVMGNDNHIWTTYWADTAGWAPEWFQVPGQAVFDKAQHIAAVSRRPAHLDLFVVGYDSHVWTTYWNHRSVQFRLRYFIEKESTDDVLQGASDEVYMSALGVDSSSVRVQPDGTYSAPVLHGAEIGDVSDDDVRDRWRDHPHVLMEFDLDEDGPWPRSYTTTLVLIESDNGDLRDGFDALYAAFGKEIRSAIVSAVESAGRVITGALISSAIGALAGAVFDAVNERIRSGLADESFTPIPLTLTVNDPDHFARHPLVGTQLTQRVEQFGGVYEILYDWNVT
ncbi:hypothetical protein ACFVID_26935 [Streptomyces sp. NPDC127132]|uniref:hypothetical protein n=1 Tax=Streptomyces sp. NPDC127132 TaxID=3345374 RepID=UPI00362EB6C9